MQVSLTAEARNEFGKGAARRARRDGRVPAVVYGTNQAPVHISLPSHELMLALKKPFVTLEITLDGATYLTAPRQIQRDPVRQIIEHVDLVVVDAAEVAERESKAVEAVAEAEAAAEAAAAPAHFSAEEKAEFAADEAREEAAEAAEAAADEA